jgi:hypothetical protein
MRIITLLLSLGLVASAQEAPQATTPVSLDKPQVISQTIGEPAFTIPAGAFKDYTFTIPEGLKRVGLFGKFAATGGLHNSIEVWVMNDDQFVNWRNKHGVAPLYNSRMVTQSTIKLPLPTDPGTYHIVFNNRFSLLTPKAVETKLMLRYIKQ